MDGYANTITLQRHPKSWAIPRPCVVEGGRTETVERRQSRRYHLCDPTSRLIRPRAGIHHPHQPFLLLTNVRPTRIPLFGCRFLQLSRATPFENLRKATLRPVD